MLGQQRDVFLALAEGRDLDEEHAQPVVEVLTKAEGDARCPPTA
jgi:hypothetical protein